MLGKRRKRVKPAQRPLPFLGETAPKFPWTARRVNWLLERLPRGSTYLEIGVFRGQTFADIKAEFKWAVDPKPLFDTAMLPQGVRVSIEESDSFFRGLPDRVKFDLVFLDGFHDVYQTYRDLVNCLSHSNPWTLVVIDDVYPDSDFTAIELQDDAIRAQTERGIFSRRWHGNVWKIVPLLSQLHEELATWLVHDSKSNPELEEDNIQLLVALNPDVLTSPFLAHPDWESTLGCLDGVSFEQYRRANPQHFALVDEDLALEQAVLQVSKR